MVFPSPLLLSTVGSAPQCPPPQLSHSYPYHTWDFISSNNQKPFISITFYSIPPLSDFLALFLKYHLPPSFHHTSTPSPSVLTPSPSLMNFTFLLPSLSKFNSMVNHQMTCIFESLALVKLQSWLNPVSLFSILIRFNWISVKKCFPRLNELRNYDKYQVAVLLPGKHTIVLAYSALFNHL